ncbi:hypothetical protein A4X09_0g331 [Tilletia walkeri]|uniref:Uncharacterized protein n=1 Tax=Tilletia walkeri TaxID=117179 RepID=A0A8X7NEW9_9BASI|nr:hypothetical protein A4X09_0g331 [Tilletia walkeri]
MSLSRKAGSTTHHMTTSTCFHRNSLLAQHQWVPHRPPWFSQKHSEPGGQTTRPQPIGSRCNSACLLARLLALLPCTLATCKSLRRRSRFGCYEYDRLPVYLSPREAAPPSIASAQSQEVLER